MPAHRFRLGSMRARMTLLFALCTTAVIMLGDAAVLNHERHVAEERIADQLTVGIERARAEAHEYEEGTEPTHPGQKDQNSPAIASDEPPLPDHARAWRRKTILEIARYDQAELAAGDLVLFVTDANGNLLWRSRKIDYPLAQRHWRTRGMWYGDQRLVLASSWEPVENELRETAFALAGLGLVLVLLSAVGAWFLVGKTLSPIDALAAQAHSASVKELSVQLQAPSPDAEMVRLATTLNNLLGRLEREARSRGRFYLAASHELRTPLQALLGNLDVALSRPREAREYEKSLQEAQRQTERLTQLVQDLLQLNALEMRTASPPPARVNVADYVERIVGHLASLIHSRGLRLNTSLPDVEIEVPPSHLEVLVRNVVENALKYAVPESRVQITLKTSSARAQLEVFNACEVPISDTASWFEAFYRPDASRNSHTGGNGLGLAIAAAIAREHDWTLDLQPQQCGVLAIVSWPLPLREEQTESTARSSHVADSEAVAVR